ncbi:MAG TPA: isoprenylcysteine carboxylmethyltransferase family protein [Gemmatimonadaceae bacterium]|jgi:protein-S-isoprenylcysteine O-methyltransferase Ste14
MSAPATDTPGVIAFPPLMVAGTLGLGLILHWLFPRHPFPAVPAHFVGAVLVVSGAVLLAWGATTMRRAGTNIDPGQPALVIVTGGPFRFTRNPLYVATLVIYVGVTLLFNALWPFVLFVPLVILLDWGVIRREERYLTAKFGEPYLAYCARARRWV